MSISSMQKFLITFLKKKKKKILIITVTKIYVNIIQWI